MNEQNILTPQSEKSSFHIRLANEEDIPHCAELDGSYTTDYVWQMHFWEDERTVRSTFSQVRLPRTMEVSYPYNPVDLLSIFQQTNYLFSSCYGETVIECVAGEIEHWQHAFVINHLIIHPDVRRKGVGKQLLKRIRSFARQETCKRLFIALQTKNYPAIQFAQKQGFVFCGYNDKYYANGDIALIFSLSL